MSQEDYRCGFIAVVGRPNVGKSTLINAIMGTKISIVTPKPQTTRHRISAVFTQPGYQAIFVDTPGLHRNAGRAMNRMMNKAAINALADADLVLFVTEAFRFTDEDQEALDRIRQAGVPAIAVMNKVDEVQPKEKLLPLIGAMADRLDFADVIPVSAKKRQNLDKLLMSIPQFLPLSPPLYPADMLTDRSESFRAAEAIREKLTLFLRQELPYGLSVQVDRYEKSARGIDIDATIWVERSGQKGIVVGKGGSMLKEIGRSARLALKKQTGVPVHLELWVKVKENWADSEQDLARLGYD